MKHYPINEKLDEPIFPLYRVEMVHLPTGIISYVYETIERVLFFIPSEDEGLALLTVFDHYSRRLYRFSISFDDISVEFSQFMNLLDHRFLSYLTRMIETYDNESEIEQLYWRDIM